MRKIDMPKVRLAQAMVAGALLATSATTTALWAQSPSGSATGMTPATVKIDFARSRGAFVHPERYNNFSRAARWTEQRDSDVQFFNENGLHGNTYRV